MIPAQVVPVYRPGLFFTRHRYTAGYARAARAAAFLGAFHCSDYICPATEASISARQALRGSSNESWGGCDGATFCPNSATRSRRKGAAAARAETPPSRESRGGQKPWYPMSCRSACRYRCSCLAKARAHRVDSSSSETTLQAMVAERDGVHILRQSRIAMLRHPIFSGAIDPFVRNIHYFTTIAIRKPSRGLLRRRRVSPALVHHGAPPPRVASMRYHAYFVHVSGACSAATSIYSEELRYAESFKIRVSTKLISVANATGPSIIRG